ncbi:MAG: type I secretion system permease/ATPase [Magnetospirillum sp.]|nr:type I secretion system permease/ATPase [Magnetospirillum sp.]
MTAAEVLAQTRRRCITGLLFAAFLSCFVNVLQLSLPMFTLQVYDRVLNSRSTDTLIMLVLLTLGGIATMGVLDSIRARIFAVLGVSLTRRLSAPALEAAVAESLRTGSPQAAQATRDINELRLFVTGSAITVPLDMAWTPLFIGVLFLLHPVYGCIALGAAVLLVGLGVIAEVATRRPLAEANAALAKSFGTVGVAMRHAEVIEGMGMLSAITARWRRAQAQALKQLDRGSARAKLLSSLSRSTRMAIQIGIIAAGVVLVLDRSASPGSLVASSILLGRALQPFEQLIDGWRQWVFAIAAWKRVGELFTTSANRRQEMVLPAPSGRLLVDGLGFLPPGAEKPVLKGVSFSLEPGEVLGVVGPSGSGKSSLSRLLVGVWEPTAGGIYLDGHNVFLWNRDDFGQYVGYLPQSVSLLDGTVRENIGRMRDADPRDVVAAAKLADVHDLIGRLPRGYDTPVGEGGFALSGGQRQRIALARALFGNPRLLVLDEPNSNLDSTGEHALVEAMVAAKRAGTTVIVAAHRPAVMSMVDKLLVLRDGMVEQFGPVDEVMPSITGGVTPCPATLRPASARDRLRHERTPHRSLSCRLPSRAIAIEDDEPSLRRPIFAGLATVAVAFGGFAAWMFLAPVDSAAVAPGTVIVDTHRKTIQHLEGGIVREVRVKDGDTVSAGQPLVVLDRTQADAALGQVQSQYWSALAKLARLRAEQRGEALAFPDELTARATDPAVTETMHAEETLFHSRAETHTAQLAIRKRQIEQKSEEISALRAQLAATQQSLVFKQEELKGVQDLFAKGYERKPRLLSLQADVANLRGRQGELTANIARVQQETAAVELDRTNFDSTWKSDIAKELQDTQTSAAELSDKLRAANDVRGRTVIIAPQDGKVVDLKVFTIGGVVAPGQPILDLVPSEDSLIVEARVSPLDIDVVRPGLPAHVRLTAFKAKKVPMVEGKVVQVAADKLVDQRTGEAYFTAQVRLEGTSLAELHGVEITPGMPAEVFLVTGPRKAVDYIVSPITDSMRRAFRED